MDGMNIEVFLSVAIPLSLYLLITLAGSFVKDMYNSIRGTDTSFRLYRILIGSLFSAFVMVGLENWFLKYIGLKEIVVIAFFVGLLSFELFEKLSNIDGIFKFYQTYQQIKQGKTVYGLNDKPTLTESVEKRKREENEKNKKDKDD
jgi:hypothetical protein